MPVLPAPITVRHLVYVADSGTDARGNPTGALAAPVDRQVIGIYQMHWADPGADPISVDFLARTISDSVLLVPSADARLYKKLDRVQIDNGGGQWLMYEVQNNPIDWSSGFTWQRYASMLAGEVHIRRVD